MISRLLERDRLFWVLSAILYFVAGAGVAIASGPLSWTLRAADGGTAGSAGLRVGLVAGLLLAAGMFALLSARRPRRFIVPGASVFTGLAAVVVAVLVLQPIWVGFLALLPTFLSSVAIVGSRAARAYQETVAADSKRPLEERRHTTVDPTRLSKGDDLDLPITGGLGALLFATGLIGSLTLSTMTTWFAPDMPSALQSDGQVTVGEGNPVKVQILYGVNYPHTAQLLGEDEGTLQQLVDDGNVELTLQGVSQSSETRLSVPVREAEACAWEEGGADAAFDYMSSYYQTLASDASLDTDVEDLVLSAGEGFGEDFADCVRSGQYELHAARALEGSSHLADQGIPQIYLNGEAVQPETLADLEELIHEAA